MLQARNARPHAQACQLVDRERLLGALGDGETEQVIRGCEHHRDAAISLCSFPCVARSFASASFVAISTLECLFFLAIIRRRIEKLEAGNDE
jgi:hypothetical protein